MFRLYSANIFSSHINFLLKYRKKIQTSKIMAKISKEDKVNEPASDSEGTENLKNNSSQKSSRNFKALKGFWDRPRSGHPHKLQYRMVRILITVFFGWVYAFLKMDEYDLYAFLTMDECDFYAFLMIDESDFYAFLMMDECDFYAFLTMDECDFYAFLMMDECDFYAFLMMDE